MNGLANHSIRVLLVGLTLAILGGCQSAYYAAWEKLGVEKREILVDRVEDARESQQEAQEQFSSALEELSALINFDGGELERVYEDLDAQFQASSAAATDVTNRIDKVESVAEALFEEWEQELTQYDNAKLKQASSKKLRETRLRYGEMLRAMRRAESTMQPVLTALQDNVLFLKHNLNANAIGALQGELNSIRSDVKSLIGEMNKAIKQSDQFIETMQN